jgi:hypothetical protein
MTTHHERRFPVILLTGTPGTGKTLHADLLAQAHPAGVAAGAGPSADGDESETPLVHLNIGDIVKQHGFHEGWDEEWQSYTVDEDRLLDYLEEVVNPEGAPAGSGESVWDKGCGGPWRVGAGGARCEAEIGLDGTWLRIADDASHVGGEANGRRRRGRGRGRG